MSKIDFSVFLPKMLDAAGTVLKDKWPEVKGYAESEFHKIGQTVSFIENEVLAGRMTEKRARLHMKMQKNAAEQILLTIEGLGILAVEAAINAALDVIKEAVNLAVGFTLI